MKKFMSICMIMVIIITALFGLSVTSAAEKVTNEYPIGDDRYPILNYNGYEYFIYNGDAIIVGYTGSAINIIIPEKIDKYIVTTISPVKYFGNNIKSVTIPKTVDKIGIYCRYGDGKKYEYKIEFNDGSHGIFSGYPTLKNIYVAKGNKNFTSIDGILYSINGDEKKLEFYPDGKKTPISIPEGTTSISNTFNGRKGITEMTFPSTMKTIGEQAFHRCTNLKKVTFNEGLQSIESMAFASCTGLESITIPDSVITIGDTAFENCKNLKNIILGKDLRTIEYNAFFNCTSLTKIAIPNKVRKIGKCAFVGCSSLESADINAKTISKYAFEGCKNLKSVTLGKNVKTIGPRTFLECNSLESISIPNNVTSIGDHAFVRCAKLKNVTIGANVESIGMGAFCDCPIESVIFKGKNVNINGSFDWNKIKKIYFCGNKNDWNKISSYNGTVYYNCKFATIKTQPTSVKAASGKKVKLTVAATGSSLKYQWQYLKNGKWVNIKNGTNATLTIKMSESAVRTWRCVVTDKYGTTDTSDSVETSLG